ncbi:uncharacterized protein LOC142985169 isoform X5 [Anticarsia gemmatalis]|uniref:uncharacterized protein LOC142985169 isoform X5 n=1 Tax=Anticarsia gemmatalis TaxID=129554 RepID=UPI003F77659E
MESSLLNGMCRCCASEGVFKDVKTAYTWMGEEEVYADMLKQCFDICLSTSEQGDDGGICEVCITQLRNAANFKKQVLTTEEQFKKHALSKLFKPSIIKLEVSPEDDNDSDDNALSGDDGYSGPEFEVPIKTEVDDPKPKKRAAASKASTSRAKKAKADNGETSTKRNQQTKTTGINKIENTDAKQSNVKKGTVQREFEKHEHNLRQILDFTNATAIYKHTIIGYMCCFCTQQFAKPADLKRHTLDTHKGDTNVKGCYDSAANRITTYRYSIRLDITDLICKICDTKIDSLEDVISHLSNEHKKMFYSDIKNHIMPFKFDTDKLTCCLCLNIFDKFKGLQEHMHKHYRNFICNVCDAGFINMGSLRTHANTHVKGTFACTYCPKIFDSVPKQKSHIRTAHTHKDVINRCPHCNEGFREYYKREEHLSKVHGVENNVFKCNACEEVFLSAKNLRRHVKKDHLMDRRHRCSLCDMQFFRLHDLSMHMVKHTGVKKFKCEVCLKSYGRKKTLKEHMKIHNGDRRFRCEECDATFVQKCSWRSHVRNRHGLIAS